MMANIGSASNSKGKRTVRSSKDISSPVSKRLKVADTNTLSLEETVPQVALREICITQEDLDKMSLVEYEKFMENDEKTENIIIIPPKLDTKNEEQNKGKVIVSISSEKSGEDVSPQAQLQSSYSPSQDTSQEDMPTTSKVQERDEASAKREIALKVKPPKRRLTDGYQKGDIHFKPDIQNTHRIKKLSNKTWCSYANISSKLLNGKTKILQLQHILLLHAVKVLGEKELTIEILKRTPFDDKFLEKIGETKKILKAKNLKDDKGLFTYFKSKEENLCKILNRLYYIKHPTVWCEDAILKIVKLTDASTENRLSYIHVQHLLVLQCVLEKPILDFPTIPEFICLSRKKSSILQRDLDEIIDEKFLKNLNNTKEMLSKYMGVRFHKNYSKEFKKLEITKSIADNLKDLNIKFYNLLQKKLNPSKNISLNFIGTFTEFELETNLCSPKGFQSLAEWGEKSDVTKSILSATKKDSEQAIRMSLTLNNFLKLLQGYQRQNSHHYQNGENVPINNDFIECLKGMKDEMKKYYKISNDYSKDLQWLQEVKNISDTFGKSVFVNDVTNISQNNAKLQEQSNFLKKLKEQLVQHTQATSSQEPTMKTGKKEQ